MGFPSSPYFLWLTSIWHTLSLFTSHSLILYWNLIWKVTPLFPEGRGRVLRFWLMQMDLRLYCLYHVSVWWLARTWGFISSASHCQRVWVGAVIPFYKWVKVNLERWIRMCFAPAACKLSSCSVVAVWSLPPSVERLHRFQRCFTLL